MEFLDVESFTFDEDRNPQIEVVENSRHVLEADTVIFAIGQRPEIPEGFGLDTATNHLIELDAYTFNTSREGVFAAGDAVTGTASVIKAIASGRQGAIALDRFLDGNGDIVDLGKLNWSQYSRVTVRMGIKPTSNAESGPFCQVDGQYSVCFAFSGTGNGKMRFFVSGNGEFNTCPVKGSNGKKGTPFLHIAVAPFFYLIFKVLYYISNYIIDIK